MLNPSSDRVQHVRSRRPNNACLLASLGADLITQPERFVQLLRLPRMSLRQKFHA